MHTPSKQFIIRGSIAIGIVAILLILQTKWAAKLFHKNSTTTTVSSTPTVGDIVGQDSNGNGITDWEEKLWGLDPTVLYTNGVPNKQIIEEKKRSLGVSPVDTSSMNETDKLSRELFTLATALGQSDQVDSQTLSQIAAKFGSSIDTDLVQNRYSSKDIQTIKTTSQSLTSYASNLRTLLAKYNKGQADIDVVVQAIEQGDESGLATLDTTRDSYRALAKDLVALKVPIGVAPYHLTIANSMSGIADSFGYIQQLSDNGLSALIGIAIYKQYSGALDTAVTDMKEYLTGYGILSS
jgi:hypothetical protein